MAARDVRLYGEDRAPCCGLLPRLPVVSAEVNVGILAQEVLEVLRAQQYEALLLGHRFAEELLLLLFQREIEGMEPRGARGGAPEGLAGEPLVARRPMPRLLVPR